MFGKTNIQSDDATFGASKAFAAVEALAKVQAEKERRENLVVAVIASLAFIACFAAAFVIGG